MRERHVARAEVIVLPDQREVVPDDPAVLDADGRNELVPGQDLRNVLRLIRDLDLVLVQRIDAAMYSVKLLHRGSLRRRITCGRARALADEDGEERTIEPALPHLAEGDLRGAGVGVVLRRRAPLRGNVDVSVDREHALVNAAGLLVERGIGNDQRAAGLDGARGGRAGDAAQRCQAQDELRNVFTHVPDWLNARNNGAENVCFRHGLAYPPDSSMERVVFSGTMPLLQIL